MRQQLIEELKMRDIGSGIYYPKPLHFFTHVAKLGYKEGDFPEAERAASEVLSLPIHPKVSPKDIDTIAKSLRELSHV